MRRVAGALLGALLVVTAATAAVAPLAAAADSRAVVVIDTGQGSRRAVITFSGTITGIQALQLAGANPVTYGYAGQGAAVCALDGIGHDATSACLGTPSDPRYWAYFRAPDGASGWSYSNQCACGSTVRDGDVEGWRFGTGQQPPFVSFCDAVGCAPPPTAAPTPPATAPLPPASGRGSASSAGSTATPGAEPGAVSNPGDDAAGATLSDGSAAKTSPVTSPATVAPRSHQAEASNRSADGLPRVRDDGGGGSPWGVVIAVAVVAMLGVLAVLVRRRRSAA